MAIWEVLLGIHPIGVEDDYFHLGGDSITSLRIISRAKQAGIRLTEADLFTHPTVAELAATVQTVPTPDDSGPGESGAATNTPRGAAVPTTHLAEDDLARLLSRIGSAEAGAPDTAARHVDVASDSNTERRSR